MNTAEIIKYRRDYLGLTLEQVADLVGVNKSTILRYENGEIEKMSVKNLIPLAEALHCSPLYLLGLIDTPYEEQTTLTAHENKLLNAYRLSSPDIQKAIDRILGVDYGSNQG